MFLRNSLYVNILSATLLGLMLAVPRFLSLCCGGARLPGILLVAVPGFLEVVADAD